MPSDSPTIPNTVFFDLDDTLLNGDSDVAWGQYLVTQGLVSPEPFNTRQQAYDRDYRDGTLDMASYLTFVCGHLAAIPQELRRSALKRFTHEVARPMIKPSGQRRLDQHRRDGDAVVLITATLFELVSPVAELMAINTVIASLSEQHEGALTGRPHGTPCYQTGKVERAAQYFRDQGIHPHDGFAASTFYSDSINDVPLLETVAQPRVVDPDESLLAVATDRGWPVLRWA